MAEYQRMQIDAAELEHHRPCLTGHCYRMLGSAADAEDAVQETIVRAWRSLDRFEGRASLRTWLHRIATNVCLDALSDNARRFIPFEDGTPVTRVSPDHPLETRERTHWLEPIPDARAIPSDADPLDAAMLRQSIRLAFVAALQHLPPRQRAALLLTDVLGWSAAEVAECLETSVAAINSALQRARATMASRGQGAGGGAQVMSSQTVASAQEQLLRRYVEAFLAYDVDGLVSLMREDVTMQMPPYTLWLRGAGAIRDWLLGPGCGCRGSRLVPVGACASPAFAQYRRGEREGSFNAWGLILLDVADDGIAGWTTFLDTETLFPMFGLPMSFDEERSQ